jgi:hypothetical protein
VEVHVICVDCKKFLRPKKNGVVVEEMMPAAEARPNGQDYTTKNAEGRVTFWAPYKLWAADLWECPGCSKEVIAGLPIQGPMAEHYMPGYQELRAELIARRSEEHFYQVPDCGPPHSGWQPDLIARLRQMLEDARMTLVEDETMHLVDELETVLGK